MHNTSSYVLELLKVLELVQQINNSANHFYIMALTFLCTCIAKCFCVIESTWNALCQLSKHGLEYCTATTINV